MHRYKTFTQAYRGLLEDVYQTPDFICAPRGQKIKEKIGIQFTIENPRARLPFFHARGFSVNYIVAEALWYFSGNDSTSWIANYSKFWEDISDDGKTANSAYGARIFRTHPRAGGDGSRWNQWDWVIDELVRDNDSRRAVIHIRSPLDSRYATKDVPCTLTLQFFLRADKLYLISTMRSSDLWLGIANDVPAFTFFQERLANDLSLRLDRKIELGHYIHQSNSLHIYERNFNAVKTLLDQADVDLSEEQMTMPSLPPMNAGLIDELVISESIIRNASTVNALFKILNELSNTRFLKDPFWQDWLKILASHRAGKLDKKDLQQLLLQSTSWPGYQFFNR